MSEKPKARRRSTSLGQASALQHRSKRAKRSKPPHSCSCTAVPLPYLPPFPPFFGEAQSAPDPRIAAACFGWYQHVRLSGACFWYWLPCEMFAGMPCSCSCSCLIYTPQCGVIMLGQGPARGVLVGVTVVRTTFISSNATKRHSAESVPTV